jgi:ribonucleoside-diphosphate reductase alpha chain
MAMAPEQTRIGIRRKFTEPGTHPYDTVAWERRDARIPNYKDGTDAFFQPDVEFPVTWSQNATNIVAQKYFRGTLGTPERESSLKQVIDRIADTITEWGVRDGYFVDGDEADAFRDELKYLLVHQRAAFNSPVWFNIGVRGVPQQASACFILAVEDTMNAILDWYREEGIIFKGGSGSGINLSNLRSSREPLQGGGTASGPVSFMRGADASAGTIKCLHADTPIATDHGVLPIREVKRGWKVATRLGMEEIESVHDNGVRPLVRVRTALGDEVLCTPEHRFRVRGRNGEAWREAGELRSDDYVLIDLSSQYPGAPQPLEPVAAGHHRELRHELPAVLDEPFALWLGWVFGDGSVSTRPGTDVIAVQIGDHDRDLLPRYEALTRSLFGDLVHLYVDRHTDRPDASVSARFASTRVIKFLEANGLRRDVASRLRVPRVVQASPTAVRGAFLAGLFEAGGHVGNGNPQLSTVSAELARDVHRLLLSIGIPSTIERIDDRAAAFGSDPVSIVRVVGGEGLRRFTKLVGFVSERKSEALEAAVARMDPRPFETKWLVPHVRAELDRVWRFTQDQQLRRAIAPYCRFRTPRAMSLLRARALVERFPRELAFTSLVDLAYGEDLYVPVTVEHAGEGPTFDLTVRDVHQYLVNSIVTHNSGGKTRRAAKMVILNADHPDIEEFIWCKAIEERKARALRDAGFDMDLDGKDSHSIQYQNANNSVRVTDEFMNAVVEDGEWKLKTVTGGTTAKTMKARDLMRQISAATWECADPGMQFDTTINRWHTAPNTGRINASNPCFPGSERVHTDKGLIRFDELVDRVRSGESFGVYTHEATNLDEPADRLEITRPDAVMITGFNEIVKLRFSNGIELRCTPNHRIFTSNRGYVEASELTADDSVKVLDLPAPAVAADPCLPGAARLFALAGKGDEKSRSFRLPEKWTPELAHYLGWIVGDGCISDDVITTVYRSDEEQQRILPLHQQLAAWMNGDQGPTPSVQANGTLQLRQSGRVIARFFDALGVTGRRAADKVVPEAIYQAPPDAVAAFLRGLFDADGCVYDGANSRYVGLGSASRDLLRGVQRLLATFGIFSRIYRTRKATKSSFTYDSKDGTRAEYVASEFYDLRVANRSIERFSEQIGFDVPAKAARLRSLVAAHTFYETDESVRLIESLDDGVELTFNLSEPRNHSYVVNGTLVANCSEYMHLDNSACNLASINLLKYLDDDDEFDVEAFEHTVEVIFTAQEILVGNADYPTEKIAQTSRDFRQLGLGYANLGALLMARGLPYDSPEGRAWAASITALMTGRAYATSARTAARMGPFAGYASNADAMLNVLQMHQEEAAKIDESLVPPGLLDGARRAWDDAVEVASAHGVRNSQASVLAPTGTIGLMMDCDTTGIEPDLALTKAKKLVGGGTMLIVNQTVPRALRRLGYTESEVDQIVAYINEHKTIVGAPGFNPEHLAVFACSMGDNTIHYMGHVTMMGAVQPFISGAISKTVNTPEDVTVEDIEQLHIDAWRLGLKAIAIYRDNCKVAQPLATQKKASDSALVDAAERVVEHVITVEKPVRRKMPKKRISKTFSFRVADCHGYVTVGEFEDGQPGEVFLKVAKQGSTLAGIMDGFAIAVSLGLQFGVPLRTFVEKFTNVRFEPAGMTDDREIRFATSLLDYIFRRLAVEYLAEDERREIGVLTVDERLQPTLPGVEEASTVTQPGLDTLPVDDTTVAEQPAEAASTMSATIEGETVICHICGDIMQRAGSCYACPSCGTTSGCS